jgi:hypothetical protein
LDGKIGVGCVERAHELILKRLNGPFHGIGMMIVGFDELEADLLWHKVSFYDFCSLIVHGI